MNGRNSTDSQRWQDVLGEGQIFVDAREGYDNDRFDGRSGFQILDPHNDVSGIPESTGDPFEAAVREVIGEYLDENRIN